MKSTLSFRMSPYHNEGHNLRTIYVPYVDVSKSKNNIYYINHTKEEAYEYLFSESVKEYNENQKRKDRRIDNYLLKITTAEEEQKKFIEEKRSEGTSKKNQSKMKNVKHSSYEIIVSLGNIQQNPEFAPGGEKEDIIVNILNEYVQNFQSRNPNAYMYMSAIHLDEQGCIHLHTDVIFYSDSYKTGMKRRVSLSRALEDMGFISEIKENGKTELAVTKWQNSEREELTRIARKYNIDIVIGNQSRQHLNREQYIIEKKKEELQKKENSIKNCVNHLNEFMSYDSKAKEFYYSVELTKKEKELEELKKTFNELHKNFAIEKEEH